MSVPIATSPARSGFGPQLALRYDSGAGNGPFGFGWSLSLPVDHPQDRPGAAALPRRRGVRRLHPFRHARTWSRSRGPRARSIRPATSPALSAADRGPVRPHRAVDRDRNRRDPLAIDQPRQRHDALRTRQRVADLRSGGSRSRPPDAHLQLADLPELRRQGQRDRLRVPGRGFGRRRWLAGARTKPRRRQPDPRSGT